MIDYIEIVTECKDTPNFGFLQLEAKYTSGYEKYFVNGCRNMELWHNRSNGIVRLKGSPLYYWQGHNLTGSTKEISEAINHISDISNIDFFRADINVLEFGKIIEVEFPPKEYILHHSPKKGLQMNEKPKDKGNFRFWNDKAVSLKMYNAAKNFNAKQGNEIKAKLLAQNIWKPKANLLKWEAHYIKPENVLNKGKTIKLYEIMQPEWDLKLKNDLYNEYKRLTPMGTITEASTKKDLSSGDIILRTFAEAAINEGKGLAELKKMLYDRINASGILTEADKKARKRQIKEMLEKLQISEKSKYDLSENLKEVLQF